MINFILGFISCFVFLMVLVIIDQYKAEKRLKKYSLEQYYINNNICKCSKKEKT